MDTKRLRQRVLDLAIHGKLVPQNPQDEPASELLKRIAEEKERLIKDGKIKKSKKKANEDIDEVPFEVPQGWVWCRLDDLASYKKGPFGSSLTKAMFVPDSDTAYKVYEQKNAIQKDHTLGSYYIDAEKYEELKGFAVLPHDIIVSCAGTIGETYVLPNKIRKGIINQALMIIRLYLPHIQNYYLYYFNFFLKRNAATEGNGTAIKNIPPFEVLKNYLFPLPPLAEQHRIVSEVERFFSLIDILEESENDLQQSIQKAKSKILDLAIKGKLVETTGEWEYTNLGSVFQHNTGKALNRSAEQSGKLLPYITTSNLYWGRFELDTVKSMYFKENEIEKCTVTKGDLLVCEGGDIGRSAIWDYDYDICIQNHIHRLRPIKDALPKFYYYVMMHYKRTDNIEGKGIGMLGLSSKQLDKLIIPLPPLAEQHRIVAKIEELFNQLDNIAEALK